MVPELQEWREMCSKGEGKAVHKNVLAARIAFTWPGLSVSGGFVSVGFLTSLALSKYLVKSSLLTCMGARQALLLAAVLTGTLAEIWQG